MILIPPKFNPLPPFTDAAAVPENIAHWLRKGQLDKIANYTRRGTWYNAYGGYRFITGEDLAEDVATSQKVLGVTLECLWRKRYHCTDSLCPLNFSEWYTSIDITMGTEKFTYCTDADLKRRIRAYKQQLTP